MGSVNKLLLPCGEGSVVGTTLGHLLAADIGPVTVVTGHEAERVREHLQGTQVRMVHNARYQEGMTTSIQAGVAAAPADAAGFMVCPGDLPLLSPEEYRLAADFFMECLREQPQVIVQPVYEQQPGHPVFFAAAYRADLLALSCPDGCRPILQANRSAVVPFTFPTDHCLRDVDTPEAYDAMAKHFF